MIELLTAMAVFGVVSAIAVGSLISWRNAQAEKGAVRQVVSSMRNVQGRALSEGTTYCVVFATGAGTSSMTTYRTPGAGTGALPAGYSCTTGTKTAGPETIPSRTFFSSAAFDQRNGSTTSFVLFYPRGAASPGTVTIARSGASKVYTITTDALTGRVSTPAGG
jgi:type II secretory pathway pseudopilin PulG